MKVFVVLNGQFVKLVTTDRTEAEKSATHTSSWGKDAPTKILPVPNTEHWDLSREDVHRISTTTGRWNKTGVFITTAELHTNENV